MLVDESAQLIYHPSFNNQQQGQIRSLSLAKYEPEITHYLLNRGYLEQSSCDDFAWKTRYHTSRIIREDPIDNMDSYPAIYMSHIQGSNLFLIIKSISGRLIMSMVI